MPTKKIVLLFLSLFLILGVVLTPARAEGGKAVRLGVNDKLSTIEAVSVKNTYYVPLRALAGELNWTITGLADGVLVTGGSGSLTVLKGDAGARLKDGTVVPLSTFVQGGNLMVPLKISGSLGYIISFAGDKYLLRVKDGSALLTDEAFISKYAAELKPAATPEPGPSATPAPADGPAQPVKTGKPGYTVYLTFDDGPSATTAQLLDILAKYDVQATFFMLGNNMNKYPSQVKRIVKDDYGLGLHGMTHVKGKFYASPAAALAEMADDNAVLKKLTGASTTLIRPPYGSKPYFTKAFRDKVLSQGYHLWDWNVDSNDWKYKEDSDSIYTTVMNQVHKLKQSKTDPVILMHDQKATLKVLPRLLETLKKEGYTFQAITKDMEPVNFWKDKR
ncbi:polysaccharide deacetylase family protein [Paenibacillus sp. MMS20-IR301]|uniref:polysaccharide deacetylase n=1 Tax=Paenibacillus sp. MMS20-IR301 TaxID=2895946 RepID=UPI0028E1E8D5|nr:polysaccharide deacetylase family protein [Paenibacillus sp. MMS20-IR301]WNS41319.1 polysaccharide deacetylase family protein [Paenibacillus sp. MMS20-IR301]